MEQDNCQPIFQLTRGETVECIHYGAVAVVDVHGKLIAHYGDPDTVTFFTILGQTISGDALSCPRRTGLLSPEPGRGRGAVRLTFGHGSTCSHGTGDLELKPV